jgi:hypothetical protein
MSDAEISKFSTVLDTPESKRYEFSWRMTSRCTSLSDEDSIDVLTKLMNDITERTGTIHFKHIPTGNQTFEFRCGKPIAMNTAISTIYAEKYGKRIITINDNFKIATLKTHDALDAYQVYANGLFLALGLPIISNSVLSSQTSSWPLEVFVERVVLQLKNRFGIDKGGSFVRPACGRQYLNRNSFTWSSDDLSIQKTFKNVVDRFSFDDILTFNQVHGPADISLIKWKNDGHFMNENGMVILVKTNDESFFMSAVFEFLNMCQSGRGRRNSLQPFEIDWIEREYGKKNFETNCFINGSVYDCEITIRNARVQFIQ